MRALPVLLLLLQLHSLPSPVEAQSVDGAPEMRIGLHGGVQTSVLRYTVFPYNGEFQSTVEQGVVSGITLDMPFSHSLGLQVDVGLWSQSWSAVHSGDPRVTVDRGRRSMVELPVLLMYRPESLPVPFYLGAGPVLSLLSDEKKGFTISYTGFTEREGWQTSRKDFDEESLHVSVAAEAGVDVPLSRDLSLQLGVRMAQPLGKTIDEQVFTLREFSVWRVRLGLLFVM
jgi:hypothetical protein